MLIVLLPYLLSALISIAIGVLAFRRRPLPGAGAFAWLALFEAVWTLSWVGQTLSPTLSQKLSWNSLQFLGAVAVPAAFFTFSLEMTGRKLTRPRLTWVVIRAAAVLLVAVIWTDPWTSLFRVQPHLTAGQPFSALVFENGPTFNLFSLYAYGLIVLGAYLLTIHYTSATRVFRLQLATVLIGIMIPWISSVAIWIGLFPTNLHDVVPITFGLSNLVVAWALFRYRLFDLVPVAYDTLVENMEDGVVVLDGTSRIVDLNPAAQRILGLSIEKAAGKPFSDFAPGSVRVPDNLQKTSSRVDVELSVGADHNFYEVSWTPLRNSRQAVTGTLLLMRNITERKLIEKNLERLAITDPLTNLFNRRYFFTAARQEFERSQRTGYPLSLLIVDIDHFKTINDTHGHATGDQVLKDVTRRCLDNLRGYDVMARYGGEEFIVLLPHTEASPAFQVGERLRYLVECEPFSTDLGPVAVTISVGIASTEIAPASSFENLMDRADQALYKAKRKGRNSVCLSGELPQVSAE